MRPFANYADSTNLFAVNQRLSYDDCNGRFRLEWEGDPDADFVLEYSAGRGDEQLKGTLKVTGTVKDFGSISKTDFIKLSCLRLGKGFTN